MASIEERETVAAMVAEIAGGKVWTGGDKVRVYLSGYVGGYVAIEDDGSRNYKALTRRQAGTRNDTESALAARGVAL